MPCRPVWYVRTSKGRERAESFVEFVGAGVVDVTEEGVGCGKSAAGGVAQPVGGNAVEDVVAEFGGLVGTSGERGRVRRGRTRTGRVSRRAGRGRVRGVFGRARGQRRCDVADRPEREAEPEVIVGWLATCAAFGVEDEL